MIIKIAGAVLIVMATGLMGYYFSLRDKFRLEELEEMKKAMTLFSGEITFCAYPLPEMFTIISGHTKGVVSELFGIVSAGLEQKAGESAAYIWEKGLKEILNRASFNFDDFEAFSAFGRTLGFSDRGQQINNTKLTLDYISSAQSNLREKYAKDAKLFRSGGILAGIMISLILL